MHPDQSSQQTKSTAGQPANERGVGYFHYDIISDRLQFSPGFAQLITGDRSLQVIVAKDLSQYIHPGDRDSANKSVQDMLDHCACHVSVRVVHHDGTEHHIDIAGSCQYGHDNKPLTIMGTVTDIAERGLHVSQLVESDNNYRTIVEQAPMAIGLMSGPTLIVTQANAQLLRVWGKDKSVMGKPIIEALPEIVGQPFPDLLRSVYESGESFYAYGAQVKLMYGEELKDVFFDFVYTPTFGTDSKVNGIMVIAKEVTEQVNIRKELEKSEQHLRSLVDSAPFPIGVYHGREMRIQLANQSIIDIWGKGNDIIGKKYADVLPELDEQVYRQLDDVYTTGQPFHTDNARIDLMIDGEMKEFYFNYRFTPIYDAAGTVSGVMNTAADVTDLNMGKKKLEQAEANLKAEVQKRTEELTITNAELNSTNTKLIHTNQELEQYAYVASHDLQEPLRKIHVFSQMLEKQSALTPENQMLVKKIIDSSTRMSQLIGNLLDFSRLQSGDVMMGPVDTAQTITSIINDFELAIMEKDARITVGTMPVIEAVALQMNQLFYNLISNALKFTSPDRRPQISIISELLTPEQAAAYITHPLPYSDYYKIEVADNGVGFDSKYTEQVFQVFKRLHSKDMYPGSGIGLALCRRIVINHNGMLTVSSEPEKGTIFTIILPRKQHEGGSSLPADFKWNK